MRSSWAVGIVGDTEQILRAMHTPRVHWLIAFTARSVGDRLGQINPVFGLMMDLTLKPIRTRIWVRVEAADKCQRENTDTGMRPTSLPPSMLSPG